MPSRADLDAAARRVEAAQAELDEALAAHRELATDPDVVAELATDSFRSAADEEGRITDSA
jgi:hypothetical protein